MTREQTLSTMLSDVSFLADSWQRVMSNIDANMGGYPTQCIGAAP